MLDHLGRNLYRSFSTVLGEAISNSWDADAKNVWIYIDRERGNFFIKDDGRGMNSDDFQNKFLKIGYSKRKNGTKESPDGRPFIGRKGIGKLALLSCSKKITIITKVAGGDYVGGIIDNSGLDDAIIKDLEPQDYLLGQVDMRLFSGFIKNHEKGTIIYFEGMKDGIKNTLKYLRKLIALYFRFSLVDESFKIYVDDKRITLEDLKDLIDDTEFVWNINELEDPYLNEGLKYNAINRDLKKNLIKPMKTITMDAEARGFIASVRVPRNLKIMSTDEKVGIDLFVNGRLREKDILRHIPSSRITESYLYGQIHYNELDDEIDRFSTSREDIVPDDEKFKGLLNKLQDVLSGIFRDWDDWRREVHKEGDSENPSITKTERKAEELYNEVSKDYDSTDPTLIDSKEKVDSWVDELLKDARYNLPSYTECFISENLIRKHISEKKIPLSPEADERVGELKEKETANMEKGNLSVPIRRAPVDTSYLDMDFLANLVDKKDPIKEACLSRDAKEYKPIRDALAHTALLTDEAKGRLTSVSNNIKGRVRILLDE